MQCVVERVRDRAMFLESDSAHVSEQSLICWMLYHIWNKCRASRLSEVTNVYENVAAEQTSGGTGDIGCVFLSCLDQDDAYSSVFHPNCSSVFHAFFSTPWKLKYMIKCYNQCVGSEKIITGFGSGFEFEGNSGSRSYFTGIPDPGQNTTFLLSQRKFFFSKSFRSVKLWDCYDGDIQFSCI